jgi:hypothetical protein
MTFCTLCRTIARSPFKQGSEGIQPVNEWLFTEATPLSGTDIYGLLHGKQCYAQPEKISSYSEFLKGY